MHMHMHVHVHVHAHARCTMHDARRTCASSFGYRRIVVYTCKSKVKVLDGKVAAPVATVTGVPVQAQKSLH